MRCGVHRSLHILITFDLRKKLFAPYYIRMKIKLQIAAILGFILLFSYCTPYIGKKSEKAAVPTEPYIAETFADSDFPEGRKLMEVNCIECHVLFEPKDFVAKEWEEILKSMIPKAKLTGRDAALVKHYIISNAKQI